MHYDAPGVQETGNEVHPVINERGHRPELLVATGNEGKLREYRELLKGIPWTLVSLPDRGIAERGFETGSSFEENAILKARGYARISGLPTLADDSGLEVEALGGQPGVYSARYGGCTTDEGRIELLLSKLRAVPWEGRAARFRCVIALVSGPTSEETAEVFGGECPGVICMAPRGASGFGYDPVFYLPDKGKTMAELTAHEKNRVSHRARAAEKVRPALEKLFEKVGLQ